MVRRREGERTRQDAVLGTETGPHSLIRNREHDQATQDAIRDSHQRKHAPLTGRAIISQVYKALLDAVMDGWMACRPIGSGGRNLLQVAGRWAEAVCRADLNPWDAMSGTSPVREAGGHVDFTDAAGILRCGGLRPKY